ncbi:MAG TPA: DUF6526 family protein [Acidobacteriaceae bacterium]|nr:DUF6526 family protein [Acidobacteriaceae bacterium]
MSEPQNYKNHTRFDPFWHFFIAPFFLLNFLFSIAMTIHHWPTHRVLFCWWDVIALMLLFAVGSARTQTLRVQDRLIRLEEQLRYQRLLSAEDLARTQSLTLRQIIGLRFASDDELPSLVRYAVDKDLSEKQIKQAVANWRADHCRA